MNYCNAISTSKNTCPLRMKCDLYDNLFKLINKGVTVKEFTSSGNSEVPAVFKAKKGETVCEYFKEMK